MVSKIAGDEEVGELLIRGRIYSSRKISRWETGSCRLRWRRMVATGDVGRLKDGRLILGKS